MTMQEKRSKGDGPARRPESRSGSIAPAGSPRKIDTQARRAVQNQPMVARAAGVRVPARPAAGATLMDATEFVRGARFASGERHWTAAALRVPLDPRPSLPLRVVVTAAGIGVRMGGRQRVQNAVRDRVSSSGAGNAS